MISHGPRIECSTHTHKPARSAADGRRSSSASCLRQPRTTRSSNCAAERDEQHAEGPLPRAEQQVQHEAQRMMAAGMPQAHSIQPARFSGFTARHATTGQQRALLSRSAPHRCELGQHNTSLPKFAFIH